MDDKKIESITISGMHCVSCVGVVQKALTDLGLESVNVDFSTRKASFSNPAKIQADEINRRVAKAGYKVEKKGTRKNAVSKQKLYFIISLLLTLPMWLHMFVDWHWLSNYTVQFALTLPVYILCVLYFGKSVLLLFRFGKPNMDLLIWFGASAAFFFSVYILLFEPNSDVIFFETAASIITLVFLGQLVEHYSVSKTQSTVAELMKKQPSQIKKKVGNDFELVEVADVQPGNIVLLREGETIGCDGELLEGDLYVDEALLTGESQWVHKKAGDKVYAGSLSMKGQAEILVSKNVSDNTINRIINLINQARTRKPAIQRLGDKVAAYFVPSVIFIAIAVFFVLHYLFDFSFYQAMMNSITVMVIACPCAVGLATPTAIAVGIGVLTKYGFFIKNASAIEILSKAKYVLFDKTGTLTDGKFKIKEIEILGDYSEAQVKEFLFSMEEYSTHPIAVSLVKELSGEKIKRISFVKIEYSKGEGMFAVDRDGNEFHLGRFDKEELGQYSFVLKKNKEIIAKIGVEDSPKPGCEEMITFLKSQQIETVMVSGDKKSKCEDLAKKIKMDSVFSECTPEQKLAIIEDYQKKGITIMIGDGLNDAPALQKAHAGIAFAAPTNWVAVESDILIVKEDCFSVIQLLKYAKKIVFTIKGNYFWAISYNLIAVPMAAIGFFTPTMGAFIMAFSDVVVVGNSLLLKLKTILRKKNPIFTESL